jgi:Zn-dependent M16 (insulinase) family peptidase
VRHTLLNQRALIANVTVDAENWAQITPRVTALVSALPDGPVRFARWTPVPLPVPEALAVPTSVNFVAKGANLYEGGYTLHGSVAVIRHTIQSAWLWEQVRSQGGAYGAACTFDPPSGLLAYLSYRDPNLLRTLQTYDGTAQFLRGLAWTDAERVRSVIGAVGRLDAVGDSGPSDAKGYASLVRYLRGESEDDRRRFRSEALSTTVEDVRAFADVLRYVEEEGSVVVMGSSEAISAMNASLGDPLTVTPVA